MFTATLYEGSAIYIFLIALGIFGHSFLSKSLLHDKIQLHLPSKSSSANFQSFCPPRSIVKEVPFYISKWHEIYTVPSYAQIITLLQIAAQSNHLCEPRFNLYFMAKLARCKASVIYTPPITLKLFGHSSIPKSFPHDNIQLNFPSKSFSGNFQSFYLERSFVK